MASIAPGPCSSDGISSSTIAIEQIGFVRGQRAQRLTRGSATARRRLRAAGTGCAGGRDRAGGAGELQQIATWTVGHRPWGSSISGSRDSRRLALVDGDELALAHDVALHRVDQLRPVQSRRGAGDVERIDGEVIVVRLARRRRGTAIDRAPNPDSPCTAPAISAGIGAAGSIGIFSGRPLAVPGCCRPPSARTAGNRHVGIVADDRERLRRRRRACPRQAPARCSHRPRCVVLAWLD